MTEYHHDWQDEATCAQVGSFMFFASEAFQRADKPDEDNADANRREGGRNVSRIRQVRDICSACPVWRECRFVSTGEQDGVWAGTTVRERREFRVASGLTGRGWNNEGDTEAVVYRARHALNECEGDVDEALTRFYPHLATQPYFHVFDARGYVTPVTVPLTERVEGMTA